MRCGTGSLNTTVSIFLTKRIAPSDHPTSAIVYFLQFDGRQRNASLNCICLVELAGRCEAKPIPVQKSNHVLATRPFFGLPADVESTTELYVAKRSDAVFRCRIQRLLFCQREQSVS